MKIKNLKTLCCSVAVFLVIACLQPLAAAAAEIKFFLPGDIDNDYEITSSDARLALRYSVNLETTEILNAEFGTDYELQKALDVDKDGEVTSADARIILRKSVGLSDEEKEAYSYSATAADAICKKYGATNVQAAVIENGKVVATYNYGYADLATKRLVTDNCKIRVASLSKLMTFAVCMALQDAGIVDIDTDISEYMGYSVRNPYYPNDAITLRMLMTHTASIRDGSTFETSLGSKSSVAMKTLLTGTANYYSWIKPGSYTVYSNFGAAIVGSVCEMAAQKSFETLAHEYIMQPLGMDAGYVGSSINDKTFSYVYSGNYIQIGTNSYNNSAFHTTLGQTCHLVQGNLYCSASDYAKFMAMLLNGGRAEDGTQILSQKSVNEMLKVQFDDGNEAIGFGTYVLENLHSGITSYTHTGSAYGFYGAYAMDKEYKNGVVVLTSGGGYSKYEDTQIYKICQDLILELMPAFR